MLRKIRKILKNVEARVKVLSVFMMLILVSLTAVFIINPVIDINVKADTVEDFSYSKKITLDHDQVPGDLTNFPVVINITDDSDLFAHCVNDSGYDIAFFDSTNTTQFAHEIEYWNWDVGNSEVDAYIWVNVSSVTSASDTVMYMYYGNDDTDQQNVEGVWDSDYLIVYHMKDSDGGLTDSTSNNNDATEDASHDPDVDDYEQTSIIGYCVQPDGDGSSEDSENWDLPNIMDNTSWNNEYTIIILFNLPNFDESTHQFFNFYNSSFIIGRHKDSGGDKVNYKTSGGGNTAEIYSSAISTDTWYMASFLYDTNLENELYLFLNTDKSDTDANNITDSTATNDLGASDLDCHGMDNGKIDEFRVSKIARSDNWITTVYNNIFNATNGGFFTIGSELESEDDSSDYSLKGIENNRVTWSGTAGNTVWCNGSGDYNEYLEINMSINATDNVTEIRVFFDNLNDTTAWINASNITMYVSSDNSSYGELGTFNDGGSNCTSHINSSNWNDGTMGANPFLGAGLTNKNASIWCIFKLTIPDDLDTDIFWTSASDSCKVYIGRYT